MVEQPRAATGDPIDRALAGLAEAVGRTTGPSGTVGAGGRIKVLDVGGGSGTRAVPLALLGCSVTVVDSSVNALAIMHRRAADAGVADLVTGVQADADRLDTVADPGNADLVLCHHLLEEVDDPETVLRGLATVVRPGGYVSVLVVGRVGAAIGQALVGRFEQARAILTSQNGRFGPYDPLRRRLDLPQVRALVQGAGLAIESVAGIGVLTGLVSGAARQSGPGDEAALAELEAAAAEHADLSRIAADLHVVGRRPSDTDARPSDDAIESSE